MDERYVFFIGDSHVVGAGDSAGLGWTGRVAAASFAAGLRVTPYNLGVRGQTSVEVAARWAAEAAPRLPDDGSALRAVFAFGANDVSLDEDGALSVSREHSLAALQSCLQHADRLGMRSLVLGPAAVADEGHNDRSEALTGAFSTLADQAGARFIPALEPLRGSDVWMREVAASDGAHPDAGGYEALATVILEAGWLDWVR